MLYHAHHAADIPRLDDISLFQYLSGLFQVSLLALGGPNLRQQQLYVTQTYDETGEEKFNQFI